MAESNKILTVSYGTFSCTLEGFDDPFGTMRGIAEYFRDLAADDRYFGAEPPTPDVEMLQNIAQGEVRRRVEARLGDNGVALRQMDGDSAPEKSRVSEDVTEDVDDETLDHGPLVMDDDYLMSDEPEDILTVDAEAVHHDAAPAETVAEKLRRIRAVVSRSRTAEDEASISDVPTTERRDRALSETIASITADLADEDDVEAHAAPAPQVNEDDTVDPEVQVEEPDAVVEAEMEFEGEVEDEVEVATSEPEKFEDEGTEASEGVHENAFREDATAGSVDGETEEADDIEASDRFDEETLASVLAHATSLDDDEYEDEIDADDGDDAGDASNEMFAVDDAPVAETERRSTKPLAPISEDDSGRLMAETDEKLNEDDGIRRRRVISQMRAAVAATKAERSAVGEPSSPEERAEEERSTYRKVLSEVVIPRSQDEKDLADLMKSERPAPLVLVSSQRVDEMSDPFDADARPHRVEREDHSKSDESTGFANFAAQTGAKELPDLIEAAAAYTAFVKGQSHFSRPEIMKRVARFDPDMNLSREAGLRSFGQLLRQGKIRKLQRGQFTIPENTRFNPAHRIAGE